MNWRRFVFFLAGVTILLSPNMARASILIPKNLRELVVEADSVVIGKITGQRSAWLDGAGSVILTHWTLEVSRTLAGPHHETVTVTEVGGTIGDITTVATGIPRYSIADAVLLPLKKDALGFQRTHGCIQGQFRIVMNKATDEEIVPIRSMPSNVCRGFFAPEQISEGGNVTLEDLVDRVKELLAEKAKKKEEKK